MSKTFNFWQLAQLHHPPGDMTKIKHLFMLYMFFLLMYAHFSLTVFYFLCLHLNVA